ncbi:tyrosine recombinase-like protein [Plakobranchus ocellatus]|uniref:Tyrosine recombinase-like protein n=1 Tax=Plakobranchus ocellatus TaxID=259542 RepID=A0AAV4BDF0_9GAST|nr:tyrosine recombinase-like protein [Plakobranchus ocellatus]
MSSVVNRLWPLLAGPYQKISFREVAKLIGLKVSSFEAVPHGPLYYRHIEKDKSKALLINKGNWEKSMRLSELAKTEIHWWLHNIKESKAPICVEGPTLIIIKPDTSLKGWGAVCDSMTAGGPWLTNEQFEYHINELELLAAYYALKSFIKNKRDIHGASEDQDGESHGNTNGTSLAHSTFFPDSIEDVNSGAGGFVSEKETTLPPKHARRIPSSSQKS